MIKSALLFFSAFASCLVSFSQDSLYADQDMKGLNSYNNVHSLCIGISNYESVKSLKYADDDAELMDKFISVYFNNSNGKREKLLNEQATSANIREELKIITNNAQIGDLVILYFAGHGDQFVSSNLNSESFFLSYDATSSREYDSIDGIRSTELFSIVNYLEQKKIKTWLIIDALQFHFADFNKLNETILFTACRSNEITTESDRFRHGLFTYYLIKGFSGEADSDFDDLILVDEARNYVVEEVRKESGNLQTPGINAFDNFETLIMVNESLKSIIPIENEDNFINNPKR